MLGHASYSCRTRIKSILTRLCCKAVPAYHLHHFCKRRLPKDLYVHLSTPQATSELNPSVVLQEVSPMHPDHAKSGIILGTTFTKFIRAHASLRVVYLYQDIIASYFFCAVWPAAVTVTSLLWYWSWNTSVEIIPTTALVWRSIPILKPLCGITTCIVRRILSAISYTIANHMYDRSLLTSTSTLGAWVCRKVVFCCGSIASQFQDCI